MRKNIYSFIVLLMGLFFQNGISQNPECTVLYCSTEKVFAAVNNCEAVILPEDIIGELCMVTNYQLTIYDENNNVVPNPVTQEYFNMSLVAELIALDLDDTCETNIIVEDKWPPIITNISGPVNINCLNDLESVFTVDVVDNCDFTIEVTDITELATIGNAIEVEITWTATDVGGNQDSETVLAILNDYWDIIQWPSMLFVVQCEEDLVNAPEPVIFNDPNCPRQITMDYVDYRSGCTINRVWTITDEESGLQTSFTQSLLINNVPPVIIAPDEAFITLEEYNNGWDLEYEVEDNCIADPTVYESKQLVNVSCDPYYFKILWGLQASNECGGSTNHVTVVHVTSDRRPKVKVTGKKSCSTPFVIYTEVMNMAGPYQYSYTTNNLSWSVTDLGNGRARVNPGSGKVIITAEVQDQANCVASNTIKFNCGKNKTLGRSLEADEFYLYPNPSNGILNVSHATFEVILVYNVKGKLVARWHSTPDLKINIRDFEPGLYLLKVKTEKGILNKKLIKI